MTNGLGWETVSAPVPALWGQQPLTAFDEPDCDPAASCPIWVHVRRPSRPASSPQPLQSRGLETASCYPSALTLERVPLIRDQGLGSCKAPWADIEKMGPRPGELAVLSGLFGNVGVHGAQGAAQSVLQS